ncbi:MAG: hypothetical protein HDT02_03630 [Bacteroidales bacterium]|nr:hypothetical protein [Bacteroidales bacterium]
MPWGADNLMPNRILSKIDADETLSTCIDFTTEVAYGTGIHYDTLSATTSVKSAVKSFISANNLSSVWMGQCADFKTFDFSVVVVILNQTNSKIVYLERKHALFCRFAPVDLKGRIPFVHVANWKTCTSADEIETIPLLDPDHLLPSLQEAIKRDPNAHKFAIVTAKPKNRSNYYPIPAYASIFRGAWYDIKQLIGVAKKSKLKNSSSIKYHIQVASGYWDRALEKARITSPKEADEFIANLKNQMIDFISGAENSGKVLFSTAFRTPDGKDVPEVIITKISSDEKEGGDYTTDIQEAVNMICFALRVHSNLVGSVPGKSQSNNSGSDKRELYTIAQALNKPYHDIMLAPHRLICQFNGWSDVDVHCDILQLTTLDQHKDVKTSQI